MTALESSRMAPNICDPGGVPYRLSVVIPVFRAGDTLFRLHERLTEALAAIGASYQIIFVEDCGGDSSWQIIEQIIAEDPHVVGLQLARNVGQHNALLAGIRAAEGVLIVTIDDDLQNPPEEIVRLYAALTDDVDVVYGAPEQERHGLLRDWASKITKFVLQEAMGANTARNVSAFRIFRTHLRDAFVDYRSPLVNIDVLLTWGTNRFGMVEVSHDQRHEGKSGYSFYKLMVHALNMITGFSTFPLQVASILGFAFSLFGGTVLAYVLTRYLLDGSAVAGFPFLASVIAVFSGVQLFSIGIIGEYLARMHLRMMEKPSFVVRHVTRCSIEERPKASS